MSVLNFKEIESSKEAGADLDKFEKFAREFFAQVCGYKIEIEPTRGPDGGVDILAIKPDKTRALISCKHYAASGKSVGSDEQNILDRLRSHGCTAFIGFYSTIPSKALIQRLSGLRQYEDIEFETFDSEKIEALLLQTQEGHEIIKRFFPKSIPNLGLEVIRLVPSARTKQIKEVGVSEWAIPNEANHAGLIVTADSYDAMAQFENELGMFAIHRPHYIKAWKQGVDLFPSFFVSDQEGLSIDGIRPAWEKHGELQALTPNYRWFILAMWSFIDAERVMGLLKGIRKHPSQVGLNFVGISWLAENMDTKKRDILGRLFLYNCPTSY
jgi:Restriction endonuclease